MSIRETAENFQQACDGGKGWEVCRDFCHDDATFTCQCDALAEIQTLEAYVGWAAGLFGPMPDNRCVVQSVGVDEERVVAEFTRHARALRDRSL